MYIRMYVPTCNFMYTSKIAGIIWYIGPWHTFVARKLSYEIYHIQYNKYVRSIHSIAIWWKLEKTFSMLVHEHFALRMYITTVT